jgi:hypothetical protein
MARMWSTPQWILDGVEVGVLVIILLRVLVRRIGGGDEEGQLGCSSNATMHWLTQILIYLTNALAIHIT